VPDEWNVEGATLTGPDGVVCSWEDNPLHLVGYSEPINTDVQWAKLVGWHYFTDEDRTHAIPYVTSYFKRMWGFCMPDAYTLRPDGGNAGYHAEINTTLDPHGHLDYADLVIPGETKEEVLFTTYTCHPNMANDNTSGMVVQTALAEWIASEPRRYTYRFLFAPETIGSLVYLSEHLNHLKCWTVAGFVLNLLGDERAWSVVESRRAHSLADNVAWTAWRKDGEYDDIHRWQDRRGSDERQFCAPGVDLPVVRLSRSEHRDFPEYHTSADDMSVISAKGLGDSLDMLKDVVRILEANRKWVCKTTGEPNLGSRGLYPTTAHGARPRSLLNVLAYCDGDHDVLDICDRTGMNPNEVMEQLDTLREHGLVGAGTVETRTGWGGWSGDSLGCKGDEM